jgi:hypothetical protein
METICRFVPLPGCPELPIPLRLYLPGVIILVHGVNSDGEWYEATERGLCEGLNKRMARGCGQMKYDTIEGGQLTPVTYMPELTADGYIRRDRNDKTFVKSDPSYSHIIRFRWGYKASPAELKEYGRDVWLNENNYWGGGPFANGCTSIADLWAEGLNDRLFLWITAQHLNPVAGRDVYKCPPRAYYVHAALRLAKLIKSIRDKQADVPISVVCHSQGNMVGIGAAFLADSFGVQADNFILANPPLSLLPDDESFADSWTQRSSKDPLGAVGRQNDRGRRETLKNYFALLRARASAAQPASEIDRCMANPTPQDGSTGFTADSDRCACGVNNQTTGRVTLYCNPHDQVISALTVQGIGWRGMSQPEIDATGGAGVFTQRVFAQGCEVGQAPGKVYDYWQGRWNKDAGIGKDGFWQPPSPQAYYSLKRGLDASPGAISKFMTIATAPVLWLVTMVARMTINAEPTKPNKGGWTIPINAPALPQTFLPQAYRYGSASAQFDQGYDPAGNARNVQKDAAAAGDPYDSHATSATPQPGHTDAPQGDEATEAQLRYEDRGRLRMKARRAGMADEDNKVVGEDEPDQATPEYEEWRSGQISGFLRDSVDQNATDHSTIVTNAMHAELAMAYDVAVGVSHLTEQDWQSLRIEADWRYADALKRDGHPHAYLSRYFLRGEMAENQPLHDWAQAGEAAMPQKIIDERAWPPHDDEFSPRPSTSFNQGA